MYCNLLMKRPFIRIFSYLILKGGDPEYSEEVFKRMMELTRIAEQEGITLVFKNEMESYIELWRRMGQFGKPQALEEVHCTIPAIHRGHFLPLSIKYGQLLTGN